MNPVELMEVTMSQEVKLRKANISAPNLPISKVKSGNRLVRISKATDQKMLNILKQINDKECGRQIRFDDLISVALDLIQPEHVQQLKDASLSNHDRFEILFERYNAKDESLTKDEFLGLVLSGQVNDNACGGPLPGKRRSRNQSALHSRSLCDG